MVFICSKCGKRVLASTRVYHCECGGLWQLDYQPPKFDPAQVDKGEWSQNRYRQFMAMEDDSWKDVSLGEGMTPIVHFEDDVLFKLDYCMPTLSFKDRGATTLVAHCKSIGVDHVVEDSSGNAGNAIAAYCSRAGIACEIFVPEGTSAKKIQMIRSHGAKVHIVPGNRDHCADLCRKRVKEEGFYYASHVYNPFFFEGTKTYIYEVFEQVHRIPKYILLPVGNGTLFLGVMKGLEHLLESGCIDHMPQIIGVQSEHCDPIYKAVKAQAEEVEEVQSGPTLAEGIAIGKPMRGHEILGYARKYGVRFVHAPEKEIAGSMAQFAKQGIYCEPTAAANYAGYREYCRLYGRTHDCLIPMCGSGLKTDHSYSL